ncbi:MAG TPA: hypothetical protein VLP43_05300 [Solirubrobacteraceae bacterium]|nr:hypothetical protein [Solirubrobacteraceae bacterium]
MAGVRVLELEEEELEEEELGLEFEEALGPLEVVVVLVPVADVHVCVVLSVPGSELAGAVAPGGRSMLKVCVAPPSNVTVTVQGSAEAASGRAPSAATAATVAAAAIVSLLRIDTCLIPPANETTHV